MHGVQSGLKNIGVKNGSENFEESTLRICREGNQYKIKDCLRRRVITRDIIRLVNFSLRLLECNTNLV